MRCHRCHGCLAYQDCWDHECVFLACACLNCGDVIDATILRNRAHRPANGWQVEQGHKGAFRRNWTGKESAYDGRSGG